MSQTPKPRLGIELRIAYLLPLPALLAGLAWTVIYTTISLLFVWWDQATILDVAPSGETRLSTLGIVIFVTSMMLGMLPAIFRLSRASEEWDYLERRPPLGTRERWREEKKMLAKISPLPRPWIPTGLGILFGMIFDFVIVLEKDIEILKIPTLAWYSLELVALFALLGRGIASNIHERHRRIELMTKADKVDLLDLSPQYRAGRYAVRNCMTWAAGASMAALFFLADDNWMIFTIFGVVSFFALSSLIPPLVRLQYRIRAAKKEEIQRLRAEIVPLRDEALYGDDINPGRLADLLSYLLHVESLPELPFDKGRMAVASLYFAVPLGSWVWIQGVQGLMGVLPFSG